MDIFDKQMCKIPTELILDLLQSSQSWTWRVQMVYRFSLVNRHTRGSVRIEKIAYVLEKLRASQKYN